MNESQTLAYLTDQTRVLTQFYIDKLAGTDLHRVYEVDGQNLNSAFWVVAHLAVTQNWLLLRSTGGERVRIPWARQFGMGSGASSREESPAFDEISDVFNEVHNRSLEHIGTLTAEQLDEDNETGFDLFGLKSKRDVIAHHIRHEGTHAGHLGWICKINGIKTL